MKKLLSVVLCLTLVLGLFSAMGFAAEKDEPGVNPFTDVKESDYFYDAVLWAVRENVTTGTSATTFSPNESCTRAQVVTFLWRSAGKPAAEGTNPFTDVKTGEYYYEAVLWAVANGITTGTSATTFGPDEACTRAQVVTFLWRSAGKPAAEGTNPFTDVKTGEYYYEAVLWAVANGITTGTSATTFGPDETCVRAQIVTFLYRYAGSDTGLKIVSQPADYQMTSSQETASFTVQISGGVAPYIYQWVILYDNDERWPSGIYTPKTSNTLEWEFTDYDFDSYRSAGAYCIITDAQGDSVTSQFAEVHPYNGMWFAQQPESYQMTSSQADAQFTVAINGGLAPFRYEWVVKYYGGSDGVTEERYAFDSDERTNTFVKEFTDYDFDDYFDIEVHCIITDAAGHSITSNVVDVLPYEGMWFTQQPESYQMTSSQEDAQFTVAINGGLAPFRYEWVVKYYGGSDGVTEERYAFDSDERTNTFVKEFTDYDFDDYFDIEVHCIITDAAGHSITSNVVDVFPK